ncbi:MAG: AI-2E family transporter [Kiritimatiellia bacterium]
MKTELRIEQLVVVAAIALLSLGCFMVLRPFISSLLWAGIICYSTWPFFSRITNALGKRRTLAALIMTLIVGFVMVLPFAIVGLTLADNLTEIIAFLKRLGGTALPPVPEWIRAIPMAGNVVADHWQELAGGTGNALELAKDMFIRHESSLLRGGLKLGQGVLQLTLSVLIAFFFYRDGASMALWIAEAMKRLAGEHAIKMTQAVGGTIKGVVYGILGTALAQGVVSAIGFMIAGIPSPFLLGFLTFCVSIIQIGPPLIWVPATVWLFVSGQTGWGIFMACWGVVAISGIDNLLRPYLISRGANLPLVIILMGVMGGILAFGFMGLFLGPTLLVAGGFLLRQWLTQKRRNGLVSPDAQPIPPAP